MVFQGRLKGVVLSFLVISKMFQGYFREVPWLF